jgi:hypothetical protein
MAIDHSASAPSASCEGAAVAAAAAAAVGVDVYNKKLRIIVQQARNKGSATHIQHCC